MGRQPVQLRENPRSGKAQPRDISNGGSTPSRSGLTYGVSRVLSARSALAAAIKDESVIAAMPVAAMALATCTIALCAAGIFPWATTCQVWNGVPIATVGACAWTVGTTQLTSPISVEPIMGLRGE